MRKNKKSDVMERELTEKVADLQLKLEDVKDENQRLKNHIDELVSKLDDVVGEYEDQMKEQRKQDLALVEEKEAIIDELQSKIAIMADDAAEQKEALTIHYKEIIEFTSKHNQKLIDQSIEMREELESKINELKLSNRLLEAELNQPIHILILNRLKELFN